MSVDIRPTTTSSDLRRFIDLPWDLYRNDPYWVAPLRSDEAKKFDRDQNPFFNHAEAQFFVAYDGNRPVGRICAHVDHLHNEFHEEQTGLFGFFESVERPEVAAGLFEAAADWLRQRDMHRIRGPFGYNTNGESGLLIAGFNDPPAVMMPYNPEYYADYIERNGFRKAKDLVAYLIRLEAEAFQSAMASLIPRVEKLSQRAQEDGYTARRVNLKDFDAEVARLREIYNEAWEANWGFVPLTEREFRDMAHDLKQVVDPDLGVVIERGDEPVAFGLALPDFNQALQPINGRLFPFGLFKLLWHKRKIDRMRLMTLGIKAQHRGRGVDALLYLRMIRSIMASSYERCECSWVLEDNRKMQQTMERAKADIYKRYRIYERAL
ncbi:MAG: N-acetyltransferase [Candidatus Bipolaricaulia bacterium]